MASNFKSVLIYPGIPFFAGMFTLLIFRAVNGDAWYTKKFLPRTSPITWWRFSSLSS